MKLISQISNSVDSLVVLPLKFTCYFCLLKFTRYFYLVSIHQAAWALYSSFHNFSVIFAIHQFQYLEEAHPTYKKSQSIFFFFFNDLHCSYRYASQQAHHHKVKFLGSQHVGSHFYVSSSMVLLHISWVLRQSGKYIKYYGSSSMIWLHIFCILYWSGTKRNVYPFTSTTFSYIFLGLTFIGNKFHNTVSLSVGWINNSHSSRDYSETVVSKKFIIFYLYFAKLNK